MCVLLSCERVQLCFLGLFPPMYGSRLRQWLGLVQVGARRHLTGEHGLQERREDGGEGGMATWRTAVRGGDTWCLCPCVALAQPVRVTAAGAPVSPCVPAPVPCPGLHLFGDCGFSGCCEPSPVRCDRWAAASGCAPQGGPSLSSRLTARGHACPGVWAEGAACLCSWPRGPGLSPWSPLSRCRP